MDSIKNDMVHNSFSNLPLIYWLESLPLGEYLSRGEGSMKNEDILDSDSRSFWEWWNQGAKELSLMEKEKFKHRLKRS
ncbi:MAG: hypothetical protein WA113_00990 [Desulfitobacteriaceae bacterium]